MSPPQVIAADWTWTGDRFQEGIRVAVDEDGRIEGVGRLAAEPTRALPGHALLPGFVNSHSHAFQRALLGSGESYGATAEGSGGDFWSWREAMYELVESLDAGAFFDLTRRAFAAMRSRGITTVGEFHYLHHGPEGSGYELDEQVVAAAREAGVRLVLLNAYYRTGGIGQPLRGAQRRFATPDLDSYWRQMERLAGRLDPATQTLGVVAHSLRAATPDEIAALASEAARRGQVFHIHVEEQPREIEECRAAYGAGPLALLTERLPERGRVTAVHCTHSTARDLRRFGDRGGTVCLCPLTEANLGDGLADGDALLAAGVGLCLGTDSNARLSMTEEMRWLELGQRLRARRRGIFRDVRGEAAPRLLEIATRGGARSLGVAAGAIEPGRWADFIALDLAHPVLCGASPDRLAAALVFGGADQALTATAVSGRWLEHPAGSRS